jgi:hypothetical protein
MFLKLISAPKLNLINSWTHKKVTFIWNNKSLIKSWTITTNEFR